MRQELREYQKDGLARILASYKAGARSVLAVSPTGSGKTTLFCHLASEVPSRVVILVHRRELATQAANRLREFGVDFGFILSGEDPKPYARVQIASVQTLVRRKAPAAGLVICDEAHLSTAQTWQQILDQYPHAKILGVTATPWRLGGKPLVGAYGASVVVATPRELREQGHLCHYHGFSYLAPDLSGVAKVGDDYNQQQTGAAMSSSAIVTNVVEQWQAHASQLSTVVFAVTVEHSQKLTAEFRAAGVRAEHLDGSTSIDQRRAILARVESGATQVLCNVGVAVEGLDIPRLKCCVLARPTMSKARAIQMMGRVRRPWQGVTARIHDHAFVIKAHGLPDADCDYSLHAKNVDPPPLRQCKKCLATYDAKETEDGSCPVCAYKAPVEISESVGPQLLDDAEQFQFSSTSEAVEPVKPPRPPVAVEWKAIGKTIEGVFQGAKEENTSYGNRVFFLVEGTKRTYSLPSTTQLAQKMRPFRVGDRARIEFTGEQTIGGNRTMKTFKVEREAAEDAEEDSRWAIARQLYEEDGRTFVQVGDKIGRNSTTVFEHATKHGWKIRPRGSSAALKASKFWDRGRLLFESGESAASIAKKLGVSVATVFHRSSKDQWTRRDTEATKREEARKLYVDRGMSLSSVAPKVGRSVTTVYSWLSAGGWIRKTKKADPKLAPRAVKFYRQGMSAEKTAAELGVKVGTVYEWLKQHGVPRRTNAVNYAPDPKRIERARAMRRKGASQKAIALKLNVAQSTIGLWLRSEAAP